MNWDLACGLRQISEIHAHKVRIQCTIDIVKYKRSKIVRFIYPVAKFGTTIRTLPSSNSRMRILICKN